MRFRLPLENILHKLDSFFNDKSPKDVNIIYIMVVVVAFAAAYPFYDMSDNEFDTLKKKVSDIATRLNEDKTYLKLNTNAKLSELNNQIKNLETELVTQKNNNIYIKNKIEAISFLIYDEKAWGTYINSISVNAQKHNVEILNLSNQYTFNNNFSFGHVLDISLKVRGNYTDTLRFMNSLEQNELVVDIHDFSIKAQGKLNSDINISVWGITYQ